MHWINNDLVKCANCGESQLHHYEVQTYFREDEDCNGTFTSVDRQSVVTTNYDDMRNNPSSRRDGVRILLDCETCEGLTELTIVQHKGQTFLSTNKFEGLE